MRVRPATIPPSRPADLAMAAERSDDQAVVDRPSPRERGRALDWREHGCTLGAVGGKRRLDVAGDGITFRRHSPCCRTGGWIARSTFDAASRRLDIHLDFPRGSRFGCPDCGAADCPAYDTEEMTWRHLDFFQHEAYLHARVPRVTCSGCGIKRVSVPWAREGSGFTLLFEALAMTMMTSMPVAAVGRLVGEHDTRLWRVLRHYVEEARAAADHLGRHPGRLRRDRRTPGPRLRQPVRRSRWAEGPVCRRWQGRHHRRDVRRRPRGSRRCG